MVIGEIGNFLKTSEKINYLSNRTPLDFDYLFIDFEYLLSGVKENTINSDSIKNDYLKRKEKLSEFISHKNVPIV